MRGYARLEHPIRSMLWFSSGAAIDPRYGYPGYTVIESVLPGSQPTRWGQIAKGEAFLKGSILKNDKVLSTGGTYCF